MFTSYFTVTQPVITVFNKLVSLLVTLLATLLLTLLVTCYSAMFLLEFSAMAAHGRTSDGFWQRRRATAGALQALQGAAPLQNGHGLDGAGLRHLQRR